MSTNIVRIHRPTLTAEEHNKRMAEIRKATERLILATEKEPIKRKERNK